MVEFLKNQSLYLFMNFLFHSLIQVTIINGKLLVEPCIFTCEAKSGTIVLLKAILKSVSFKYKFNVIIF